MAGHLNGLDAPHEKFTARIGESEYEVRWSFHAEYILSTRGTTLGQVLTEVGSRGKHSGALGMELIAAMVAHQFPKGSESSADHLARMMKDGQYAAAFAQCISAGRAAGAIVDTPKNAPAPSPEPAQTAPTA